jgi:hypothetical protein
MKILVSTLVNKSYYAGRDNFTTPAFEKEIKAEKDEILHMLEFAGRAKALITEIHGLDDHVDRKILKFFNDTKDI